MRKVFWKCFGCSGDLGGSKYIYLLSQMTKITDPHKEIRAETEEKGKDNENLQDMCKNHQNSVTWKTRGELATEKKKKKERKKEKKKKKKKKKKKNLATYIIYGLQ